MSEIIENRASVVKFRISLYFAQETSIEKYFQKNVESLNSFFIFFEIGQSLKIRHIGLLRKVKLAENYTFMSRSYVKTQRRLLMKHKHTLKTHFSSL